MQRGSEDKSLRGPEERPAPEELPSDEDQMEETTPVMPADDEDLDGSHDQ